MSKWRKHLNRSGHFSMDDCRKERENATRDKPPLSIRINPRRGPDVSSVAAALLKARKDEA